MLGTYICILNQSINNDLEASYLLGRSSSFWYLVKLDFGNAGFWGEGKTGVPGEKPLRAIKKGPTTKSTHVWRPRQHWNPRTLVAGECSHPWAILVHSWPLTSAKMLLLFTRPKSLIWSFLSLKLRYPALYSICSSGAGFIAACNHNYTLFLFNCQWRILWCHSPYATAELFDELKVSAPLFLWTLIFQWTAV